MESYIIKNTDDGVFAYDERDVWHEWLTRDLHDSNSDLSSAQNQRIINSFALRAIENAQLDVNQKLLDVGSGEGVVAFLAIDKIGPSLQVVMLDISQELLDLSRQKAISKNVIDQCLFVKGSMKSMSMIENNSIDRIITRASLAYIDHKVSTLQEFLRVLKPGGMISLAEPIFHDSAMNVAIQKKIIDQQIATIGHADADKLLIHKWQSTQFPDLVEQINATAFINFTERDLVDWTKEAGFSNIHMEFHMDEVELIGNTWEYLLNSSMHPLAPKLSQVLEDHFSEDERLALQKLLFPDSVGNSFTAKTHMAYLTAQKS